jgi:hypothetical protein
LKLLRQLWPLLRHSLQELLLLVLLLKLQESLLLQKIDLGSGSLRGLPRHVEELLLLLLLLLLQK